MSVKGKNGNGRIAKYNRQVADKAGLRRGEFLPYAPDFLDSLVRRMAIPVPGETAERCLAWLMYRAGGNQSLKAIHLYSEKGEPPIETELWQSDCALELAWVEAGHRAEWLDAPRSMFQAEAKRRGVKPIDKSVVSRGFQFNRLRGSMECETGYALVYVPAPDPTSFSGARETCRRKGESLHKTLQFTQWARFSYAKEFEEYTVARATERRLLRFLTAAYKNSSGSEASETDGAPSLEALEPLEPLEAPSSSSASTYSDGTTTTPEPPAVAEEPGTPAPRLPSFHEAHVAVWYAAKKNGLPTPKQSSTTEAALSFRSQEFLRWLTPKKLSRVDHPGALPSLVAEFLQSPVEPPPPEPVKCWNCDGSLEGGSSDGLCWPCAERRAALRASDATI